MKQKLYTLGASFFALMVLSSFNPLAQNARLAQVESSVTYASEILTPTLTPAQKAQADLSNRVIPVKGAGATASNPQPLIKKKKKKPASNSAAKVVEDQTVPYTPKANFFKNSYDIGVGRATAKPGMEMEFTAQNKKYIIKTITLVNAPTANQIRSRPQIDQLGANNEAPVDHSSSVEICVEQTTGTSAGICPDGSCKDSVNIGLSCGIRSLDFFRLTSGDTTTIHQLSDLSKNIVEDRVKQVTDDKVAKDKIELECAYGRDYKKVAECAKNHYQGAEDGDGKGKSKYAKMFRAALFKLARASDTDPSDIYDLKDDIEITSPELLKSWDTAYRLSNAYQKRPDRGDMNMFEYYKYQLDQITNKANFIANQYSAQGLDIMANQVYKNLDSNIRNLSRDYSAQLTTLFGRPGGPFNDRNSSGLTSGEYASLIGTYLNEAKVYANPQDYASLYNLVSGGQFGVDSINQIGQVAQNGNNRDLGPFGHINANTITSSNMGNQNCYDRLNPTNVTNCNLPRTMDQIGNNSGGSWNAPAWLNAASAVRNNSQTSINSPATSQNLSSTFSPSTLDTLNSIQ